MTVFNMGGYGMYVWSAYGTVLCILAIQLFLPWQRSRKINSTIDDE